MKEALCWTSEDGCVRCRLCAHHCLLKPQAVGVCKVRKNVGGRLYSMNYGSVVASNIDPVEKKPLFHFHPAAMVFSVAAQGCNFSCRFCQNSTISQAESPVTRFLSTVTTPEDVVHMAKKSGCEYIAHTYTEPTVYFEFVLETAILASKNGIGTILVSNGFMSQEAAEMLTPYVDAINIDLKCWSDHTYKTVIGGRLQPVLDNIERFHKSGVLVEVTTLVVPDMNSSSEELRSIAQYIASVDVSIPWHVSRFYPAYKMTDKPPAPVSLVKSARDIGLDEGLRYVYTGNLPDDEGISSFCFKCRELLVERRGYRITLNRLDEDTCPVCGSSNNFRL